MNYKKPLDQVIVFSFKKKHKSGVRQKRIKKLEWKEFKISGLDWGYFFCCKNDPRFLFIVDDKQYCLYVT